MSPTIVPNLGSLFPADHLLDATLTTYIVNDSKEHWVSVANILEKESAYNFLVRLSGEEAAEELASTATYFSPTSHLEAVSAKAMEHYAQNYL